MASKADLEALVANLEERIEAAVDVLSDPELDDRKARSSAIEELGFEDPFEEEEHE